MLPKTVLVVRSCTHLAAWVVIQAQRLDPKLRKEVGEKLKYLASRIKAQDQKDMAEIGVHNYP